jgi:hypothetical protein
VFTYNQGLFIRFLSWRCFNLFTWSCVISNCGWLIILFQQLQNFQSKCSELIHRKHRLGRITANMLLKTTVEVVALTKHLPFSFMIMVKGEDVPVHTIRHVKWRYS